MSLAFLAAVLFAASAVCGQGLTRQLGGISANALRITIACTLLAILSSIVTPGQWYRSTVPWLMFSGALGFGLGDIALYVAYPLMGARLAVLVNLCLATLVGALADWAFLGTQLTLLEVGAAAVTLTGIVMALHRKDEPFQWNVGLGLTLFAGTCQGIGLMLSRHAQAISRSNEQPMSGLSQAFQRTLGGVLVGWTVWCLMRWSSAGHKLTLPRETTRRLPLWLIGASIFGPVAGVSAMQVALEQVGSSAIVSAITATAPLLLLPFSRLIDRERPTSRAMTGSLIAVLGLAALAWLRQR
ncbi:MAG: hypothetical protein DWH91_08525 [Planctomycetota bacterium]|nr:MAG: hypothetical protein DWH91_08525 [Planctomycetota bacterium]